MLPNVAFAFLVAQYYWEGAQ